MLDIANLPEMDETTKNAVNGLCARLVNMDKPPRLISFSACNAGGDEFDTVLNLARVFAVIGKSVLIVAADMRNASLADRFDIGCPDAGVKGLAHLLSGDCAVEQAVCPTNIPNLSLIPAGVSGQHRRRSRRGADTRMSAAGKSPGRRRARRDSRMLVSSGMKVEDPFTLLSSACFRTVLQTLRERFDYVFVHTPEPGALSDAAVIAGLCDGTVLFAAEGKTTRKEMNKARTQMETLGGKVLGAILLNASRAPVVIR
jgi:Mrp family chromosome partitioning ATPase